MDITNEQIKRLISLKEKFKKKTAPICDQIKSERIIVDNSGHFPEYRLRFDTLVVEGNNPHESCNHNHS